jgi:hypothetical protein
MSLTDTLWGRPSVWLNGLVAWDTLLDHSYLYT